MSTPYIPVARGQAGAFAYDYDDARSSSTVARVVASVAPEARALAWLHDVLEQSPTTAPELCDLGLSAIELAALELLTRTPGESYELYALRIAYAPGAAGRLARMVKLADLDDHIAGPWALGDPPYEWARRHIAVAAARAGEGAGGCAGEAASLRKPVAVSPRRAREPSAASGTLTGDR
jgi:hypothetical protein